MASPSLLLDVQSTEGVPSSEISGTQDPADNPFDILKQEENVSNSLEFQNSPLEDLNISFKDIDRPSLAPLDSNMSELARESLGILPNAALCRDSLSTGLISVKEMLNASVSSSRESLGVLNISALDLGRESIGIFNIQTSFLKRKSLGTTLKENLITDFSLNDFNSDNIESGLTTFKKSPLQSGNPIPELVLSSSTTQEKINSSSLSSLNNAFILPHSRMLSVVSSGSSGVSYNPYFNSKSLEEPSKISTASSQKDVEASLSVFATTDPFNEAFQISTGENNKHSLSQILPTSTKKSFVNGVESLRNRIQSLPVALENNIFSNLDFRTKVSNVSFQDDMICRGIEDEREFDDSVFLEAKRVASIIADTSFIGDENSFDSKEHNILDATPQPEWPAELDSSHSNIEEKMKSPRCIKETILKQVDKMLGMQPINLEEKLKLKNTNKSDDTSLENLGQDISKISRTSPVTKAENKSCTSNSVSQNISKISKNSPGADAVTENQSCTSNNFSQNISKISRTSQEGNGGNVSNNFSENLSKITQSSEENASRLIQNLSDILNENENLSHSQKKEGQHMLQRLASWLCHSKSKISCSAEDSGHSSVDDQHVEENKDMKNNQLRTIETVSNNDVEEICHALDLSCRGNNCSTEISKRLSMSKSPVPVRNPASYLVKTLNRIVVTNTTSTSIGSNTSDTNRNTNRVNHSTSSNHSNTSAKSGNVSSTSRHSNISQNRVSLGAGKLRKSKMGVVVGKKGPLRAVLPVENMAKGTKNVGKGAEISVTPEKQDEGLKFGLRSKKTSTPIHEPKLKPMAASTPALRQSKEPKESVISPLPRPKYTRSFSSYQPRTSNTLEKPENIGKSRESMSSISKPTSNKSRSKVENIKPERRNSVTERPSKESEGPMRIKRSFSTGKEPKILSALSRVRQNILSSPYYKSRKSTDLSQGNGLTENAAKMGTDLKRCEQELKKLSMLSQPKKLGKENFKP